MDLNWRAGKDLGESAKCIGCLVNCQAYVVRNISREDMLYPAIWQSVSYSSFGHAHALRAGLRERGVDKASSSLQTIAQMAEPERELHATETMMQLTAFRSIRRR